MNYNVYVDGVHLPRVDTMLTTDKHLWLKEAPPAGAPVIIQIHNGWTQGFVGTGTQYKFPLSPQLLTGLDHNDDYLMYKQILHDAMRSLDNEAVRSEIERLATVVAMVKDYDTIKS